MYKTGRYAILFVVLLLLQILLFDNLNISIYLYPIAYLAFFVLLPMNINSFALLMLGLATGVMMDFFTGMNGVHTITTLATAFFRPLMLNLTVGKDTVMADGVPIPREIGRAKWFRYAALLVGFHCLLFFLFEALTFRYLGFTLLRALGSAVVTFLFVWLLAVLYPADSGTGNIRRP